METYTTICKIAVGVCCVTQETQTRALRQPRGMHWGGSWEGDSRGRAYIYTYG